MSGDQEKRGADDVMGSPHSASSTPPARTPMFSLSLNSLPSWVTDNIRSKKSWKLLFRCWLATWVSFIIILPSRSLTTLGSASFFALLASLMLPPNMPVQLFLMAMSMIVIGMLLGWGIGAAAMRAALAVRDQVLLADSLRTVQQNSANSANPDAEFQLELFQGAFLDTRSSVIYGCFLGVASFIFALIRAYAPKLAIMSIFGSIVVDVFCSYGPLFPSGVYTLVNSLLISVGVYIGIAVVCIIFIFPETMNHSYLALVTKVLGDTREVLNVHSNILDVETERELKEIEENGKAFGIGIIADIQELETKGTFINGEFSWGRWNGDDVKALEEPLKILQARISGFQSFVRLLDPSRMALISGSTISRSEASSTVSSIDEPTADTELIRQLLSRHQDIEEKFNLRIADVLPVVKGATAELRETTKEALDVVKYTLEEINTFRWTRGSNKLAVHETRLNEITDRLRADLAAFKSSDRLAILQPFLPVLDSLSSLSDVSKRRAAIPIRSLTIASVFAAHTILTANAILSIADMVIATTHKRPRSRLWAPSGLRALAKAVLRRDKGGAGGKLDHQLGEEKPLRPAPNEQGKEDRTYRRDPDSRPPSNAIQKVMNGIHAVYKWTRTPEAIFSIKYVILTIGLWLPSVFKSTAYFMYVQKSVWALTMAQTVLNIYVADQIYNYVARIIGTVLGLIAGVAAWYIGNGSGNGNPYGSAAAMAVFLVPAVFTRVFAPISQIVPLIMFSVTLALIYGYSWIDGHLFTIGNPGIGWNIAWKRFVLVIIGCAASFIVMFIPPTSGRKAVRMRNALIITELSSLYAFLMSSWIEHSRDHAPTQHTSQPSDHVTSKGSVLQASVQVNGTSTDTTNANSDAWGKEFRARLEGIAEQIQILREQTAIAKWEGNIRGAWPRKEYERLVDREWEMLVALAQLGGALVHINTKWRGSPTSRTRILNPNFFTDVMTTFSLVAQSLRTAEPMHQVIPTSLLDRLLYHQQHQYHSRSYESRADAVDQIDIAERIKSLDFVFFATGVAAVSQIISSLDDMHKTTRELCGEVPFKGFEEWKNDFDRVYSTA